MKKILIICRDYLQKNVLIKLISTSQNSYIVASDDYRIHRLVENHPNVCEVCWLSQMNTIYSISEEVVNIIKQVNEWYKDEKHANLFIYELLYWVMHIEGGITSQRVCDFLLTEKSYEAIFNAKNPDKVIIIRNFKTRWENNLIIAIARKRNLQVSFAASFSLVQYLRNRLWLRIRPFAIGAYQTAQIVNTKLRSLIKLKSIMNESGEVGIQLVSSSKNHQNHTKVLARALRAEGLDPIILGWQLGTSAADLRKEGFKLTELEREIRFVDLILVWYRILIAYFSARRRIKTLMLNCNYCANGQVLRSTLSKSVLDFYFCELPSRAFFKCAALKYAKKHSMRALRPHSLVLPEGVILFREIRRLMPKALVFMQGGWPYNIPEPITDSETPIPRSQVTFFACSGLHRQILIDKGFQAKSVFITGLHWVESVLSFGKRNTKLQSRETLSLPKADWFILLDVNYVLLGYFTEQEQITVLNIVLNFAQENANCCLMIKPHPGSNAQIVKELIDAISLPNITMINKADMPYHALNAADVLITKVSTLAVEAMYLDVPTIGVILDYEPNWKVYGNGVEYEYSILNLKTRLKKLLDNRAIRQAWCVEMRERQRSYLESHNFKLSNNPTKNLAITLKNKLNALESTGLHF
jgi:hypothetical protein